MSTPISGTSTARAPIQLAALVVGAIFLLVGVLGFIPGVTTDYDMLAWAGHESHAQLFGIFTVSVLHNIVHLVAESLDEARSQWVDVFHRDRADLGPSHAVQRAADDIDRYGPNAQPTNAGTRPVPSSGPRRPPPSLPAPPSSSRGIGR